MSSGMVISGSMVASFLENTRPFTRSLSGKKMAAAALENSAPSSRYQVKLEDLRNCQSDTELLTSFGEASLPSPGALKNTDVLPDYLGGMEPSPQWGDMVGKITGHGEWQLGEELPTLFDSQTAFLPRPDSDANMLDNEEGINGSVEQTQPPAPADVSMGDVDNDRADDGEPAAADSFLSSLFDWDKEGNTPTPKKEETGQGGANAIKAKAASPAIRYTRSRSFELRKLVEQKGYSADSVMKAIDEGRIDPAVVWAKAAAENAAASRPVKQEGGGKGQAEKERTPDMVEELKRLVTRSAQQTAQQSTLPSGTSRRSPGPSPLSCLSPRLRHLLDAQLPDTPSPSSITQSEGAPPKAQAAPKTSAPPLMTVPLTQPRHRGRPQPLKGLTSAQKIEPLRTTSDPGSQSKKRGLATEMLPPVKRSSSSASDTDLGRATSSISEVVRAYSGIRTSASLPPAKPAETKRRGRGKEENQSKQQQQRKLPPPVPAPAMAPAPTTSTDMSQIQLLVKAQKAEQLEEENRALKQYLNFLNKKDNLQVKLIEQLEQQLMKITDERDKLLALAEKR